MKRLRDFFFGRKLKNRAGGMAWIRMPDEKDGRGALNNRAVRTVRCEGDMWTIDPPQPFTLLANVHYVDVGATYLAGETVTVCAIADDYLEPWKDDGVTDDEVAELYSHPTQGSPHEHRTEAPDPARHLAGGQAHSPVR